MGDMRIASDAAAAHGGAGLLNTDWGDQGHLQYLPVSEPGFAYGAAMAWCRETNRDLDLAAVLNMRETPGQPIAGALVTALRERSLLLVLDNCEHVLDTCAQLVDGVG